MAAMTFRLIRAHLSQLRWMWLLFGYVLLVAYAMTAANQFFVEGNISIGLAVWTGTMLFICIMMFSPSAINARAFGLPRPVFLKATLVVSAVVLLPVLVMAVLNGLRDGAWLIIGLTLLLTALWSGLSYWRVPTARADENKVASSFELGDREVLSVGPLAVRVLIFPQVVWSLTFGVAILLMAEFLTEQVGLVTGYAVMFLAVSGSGGLLVTRSLATWQAFGKSRRSWMLYVAVTSPLIAAAFTALLGALAFPGVVGRLTLVAALATLVLVGLSGLPAWVNYGAVFSVIMPLAMAMGFAEEITVSNNLIFAFAVAAALSLVVFYITAGRGTRPAKQIPTTLWGGHNNARR